MTIRPEIFDKAADRIHESVCDAAGWQVRCDRCGGYTKRGNGVMVCRNDDCQTAQEKETEERIIRQEKHWEQNE